MSSWVQPLTSIRKKTRNKNTTTNGTELELRIFEWTMKDAFNTLKEALTTAPVLGYPDFSREFILETDKSLKGLGTVISQQSKDRTIDVIGYASHSLCPQKDQCAVTVQLSWSC